MSLQLFLGLLALGAHLLRGTYAYTITVRSSTNALLAPGQSLSYNIAVDSGDTVVLVDILFVNGNLGNTTNIAVNSDLTKAEDRRGEYLIPVVPPGKLYSIRLVNTSTKELLKDSTTFEVFAPGSTSISSDISTLPPTSLPTVSGSQTLTSGSSSTGITDPNSASGSSNSKSAPVGAIVGGVIGGLIVLGAFLVAFLYYKRRRNSNTSTEYDEKTEIIRHIPTLPPVETPKEPQAEVTVTPFPAGPPTLNASSMFSKGNNPYDITPSTTDFLTDGSPRSASSGDNFTTYASLRPTDTETRADALRRERERISREIADLESRSRTVAVESSTSGSTYPASSLFPPSTAHSGNSELRDQVAVLQEQIRQIEARQMQGVAEPPPQYEGPPQPSAEDHNVLPSPAVGAPSVDIKTPIS